MFIEASRQELQTRVDEGYQFIAFSIDSVMLGLRLITKLL